MAGPYLRIFSWGLKSCLSLVSTQEEGEKRRGQQTQQWPRGTGTQQALSGKPPPEPSPMQAEEALSPARFP